MKTLSQRLRLGNNAVAAAPYIKLAKKRLRQLKFRMSSSGIKALFENIRLADGTHIIYGFVYGEERISIFAPLIAGGVEEEEKELVLVLGLACIPASDLAPFGWGPPFTDAQGNPINAPLGTPMNNEVDGVPTYISANQARKYRFRRVRDLKWGAVDWVGKDGEVLSWRGVGSNRYFQGPYSGGSSGGLLGALAHEFNHEQADNRFYRHGVHLNIADEINLDSPTNTLATGGAFLPLLLEEGPVAPADDNNAVYFQGAELVTTPEPVFGACLQKGFVIVAGFSVVRIYNRSGTLKYTSDDLTTQVAFIEDAVSRGGRYGSIWAFNSSGTEALATRYVNPSGDQALGLEAHKLRLSVVIDTDADPVTFAVSLVDEGVVSKLEYLNSKAEQQDPRKTIFEGVVRGHALTIYQESDLHGAAQLEERIEMRVYDFDGDTEIEGLFTFNQTQSYQMDVVEDSAQAPGAHFDEDSSSVSLNATAHWTADLTVAGETRFSIPAKGFNQSVRSEFARNWRFDHLALNAVDGITYFNPQVPIIAVASGFSDRDGFGSYSVTRSGGGIDETLTILDMDMRAPYVVYEIRRRQDALFSITSSSDYDFSSGRIFNIGTAEVQAVYSSEIVVEAPDGEKLKRTISESETRTEQQSVPFGSLPTLIGGPYAFQPLRLIPGQNLANFTIERNTKLPYQFIRGGNFSTFVRRPRRGFARHPKFPGIFIISTPIWHYLDAELPVDEREKVYYNYLVGKVIDNALSVADVNARYVEVGVL